MEVCSIQPRVSLFPVSVSDDSSAWGGRSYLQGRLEGWTIFLYTATTGDWLTWYLNIMNLVMVRKCEDIEETLAVCIKATCFFLMV